MIFQRAKDVPSTPKIGKIALPGGDTRPSTPMNMPPPRSTTPMTTTGGPSAVGRPALIRRDLSSQAEAPSMNGYLSEPGGGSSPTNLRRTRMIIVPTKTEDGPSRPLRLAGGMGTAAPPARSTRLITATGPEYFQSMSVPSAGAELGPGAKIASSRPAQPDMIPAIGPKSGTDSRAAPSREPQEPVIVTPRPRRPSVSVVADITPRPRKPSVLGERPVLPHAPRDDNPPPPPPGSGPKRQGILKNKGDPPRKRTLSFSKSSTIPDIHWRLLPYDKHRAKPCQHFNIALPPDSMITACRPSCHKVNPKDMSKPAASEKLTRMIIKCNELPWEIVVKCPDGITCLDVFQAIHDTFDTPLSDKERAQFPIKVQQCKKAFELRCKAVPRLTAVEERVGMKRVDLLNCRTYFHGLIKPGVDEPWLMILGSTPPCSGMFMR